MTSHPRRPRSTPAVVGYVRVSTDEQATSGLGLDAQRVAIADECDRRGWELVEVFEDAGASGKSMAGRPALQEALNAVRSHRAGALVVAKLDRLSRSLLDFAALMEDARKEGWALVILDLGVDTTTPSGRDDRQRHGDVRSVRASVDRAEDEGRARGQETSGGQVGSAQVGGG